MNVGRSRRFFVFSGQGKIIKCSTDRKEKSHWQTNLLVAFLVSKNLVNFFPFLLQVPCAPDYLVGRLPRYHEKYIVSGHYSIVFLSTCLWTHFPYSIMNLAFCRDMKMKL